MEDIETFNKKKRHPDETIEELISPKDNEKDKDKGKEKKDKEKNAQGWKNMINFDNLKNEKFEFYYKIQLGTYFPTEESFKAFIAKLKEKLPCVFRINKSHQYSKQFHTILTNELLIPSLLGQINSDIKISPVSLISFPEWKDLVFNINIPRMELKKNSDYSKFHKFIQLSVDCGLISRQEAVSMIPPMIMQCKSTDKIFDMCAAPGSKTAQFLEVIYDQFDFLSKDSLKNDTGFVLANDNNPNRAYMMVHQLKRLNTAGMIVISHDAQFFPTIFQEDDINRLLFDKILADVPCSSDAVMRKLPNKWKHWGTKDSFSLHKLQIQILKRGLHLLKVGGSIVYSTCSLNPIEDEAVVAEIIRSLGQNGELEVVNMSHAFYSTDIKHHNGLINWKVFIEDQNEKSKLVEIKDVNDPLYNEYKDKIDSTCFPPTESEAKTMNLNNCIRLFPHDSDTSGFFITLIRKIAPLSTSSDKASKNANKIVNTEKGIDFMKDKYEKELQWIIDYYGIDEDFPRDQLVTQSESAKKINFVSKGVSELLKADKRNQMKLQNAGVKLFKKNKSKSNEIDYCLYRICQDGLMYALPYMHKRVYFITTDTFVQILKTKEVIHDEVIDIDLRRVVKETKPGCIVVINVKQKPKEDEYNDNHYLKENFIDAMCCYNANTRLTTMTNKEHQHVFNMKYELDK